MTTKKQSPSRVTQEILEMADDMRRIGIMAAKTHHQIMVRLSGPEARRYTSLGRSPR
jgi:putative transcriptional regulator